MHAPKLWVGCALAAFGAVASTADARDVFRCNGSIVDTGMTASEVLARCGEPDSREVSSVPIRARGVLGATYVVGTTSVEYWIYDRSPGQFRAYLVFDQGRLRNIDLLDRR